MSRYRPDMAIRYHVYCISVRQMSTLPATENPDDFTFGQKKRPKFLASEISPVQYRILTSSKPLSFFFTGQTVVETLFEIRNGLIEFASEFVLVAAMNAWGCIKAIIFAKYKDRNFNVGKCQGFSNVTVPFRRTSINFKKKKREYQLTLSLFQWTSQAFTQIYLKIREGHRNSMHSTRILSLWRRIPHPNEISLKERLKGHVSLLWTSLLWIKKGKIGDLPYFDLFRLASLRIGI